MQNEHYSTVVGADKAPHEVFAAIHKVRQWWTENAEGSPKELHDEFTVTFGETYIKLKVVELIDNQKVVWEVTDCHKHFVKNKKEWVGTRISFELTDEGEGKTRLTFNHFGLSQPLECYEICCDAWGSYLHGRLKKLISQGYL